MPTPAIKAFIVELDRISGFLFPTEFCIFRSTSKQIQERFLDFPHSNEDFRLRRITQHFIISYGLNLNSPQVKKMFMEITPILWELARTEYVYKGDSHRDRWDLLVITYQRTQFRDKPLTRVDQELLQHYDFVLRNFAEQYQNSLEDQLKFLQDYILVLLIFLLVYIVGYSFFQTDHLNEQIALTTQRIARALNIFWTNTPSWKYHIFFSIACSLGREFHDELSNLMEAFFYNFNLHYRCSDAMKHINHYDISSLFKFLNTCVINSPPHERFQMQQFLVCFATYRNFLFAEILKAIKDANQNRDDI